MKVMDNLEVNTLFTEMSNCSSDSDVLNDQISHIFKIFIFVLVEELTIINVYILFMHSILLKDWVRL
jgi:hypothetical protein